tara:strand:- start:2401 stop:2583 length:183 start_codon:yes stop_codon:yes gene_type:complete
MDNNELIEKKKKFIYAALENGWTVSKKKDLYIFRKKHEKKTEVYLDSYLTEFIKKCTRHM